MFPRICVVFKLAHGEALQGFACRYNRVWRDPDMPGGYGVLARGCFANSLRNDISFLLGHNARSCIGTTSNSMLLYDCDEGLAFRLFAPPIPLRDAIAAGDFRSMSCGFDYVRTEQADIGGERVTVIREAALREISLVDRPAVDNTSIALVDLADAGTLREAVASGRLKNDGAYSKMMNAADDLRRLIGAACPETAPAAKRRAARRRPMPIDISAVARKSSWFKPGTQEAFAQIVTASGERPGGVARAMWKHGQFAMNSLQESRRGTRLGSAVGMISDTPAAEPICFQDGTD
jgi:HK97 family phage prohead protease